MIIYGEKYSVYWPYAWPRFWVLTAGRVLDTGVCMYLNSDRFFKTLIMGNGFITVHVYSCTSALAPQNFEYFREGLFAYLKQGQLFSIFLRHDIIWAFLGFTSHELQQ